jgi:hypothetical protein
VHGCTLFALEGIARDDAKVVRRERVGEVVDEPEHRRALACHEQLIGLPVAKTTVDRTTTRTDLAEQPCRLRQARLPPRARAIRQHEDHWGVHDVDAIADQHLEPGHRVHEIRS